MPLRVEIWDPPGIAAFERRIAGIKGVANVTGTSYRRQLGSGQFTIPADYDRMDEIVDVDPANHANDVASLARVYRDTVLIQELLIDGTPNVISDSPSQVSGHAIEAVMDWAIVEAWDWDGSDDFLSRFPDWIFGGRNVLVDPTFTDPRCSPRISEFWTDATSGSWTATVDGQTTAGIAFNAGPLDVENAYQALSTVDDVLVEGTGANDDPWRVTFVDPCFPTTYSVSSGTLNGVGLVSTLIELGSFQPSGWTVSKTLSTGVPIIFGDYTTFEVDTAPTPAPSGTTTGLHVVGTNNGIFHFPGAQTTPSVIPGGLYQAGVWVYPVTTNQDFRLVLRPLDEEPLIDSSTWPSVTLTANTWTLVPIVDAMIPEGIERVIFRIAAIEDTANFWVTDAYLTEGQAATTVGDIMGQLLDDAQTDHAPTRTTIDFINPTFTDLLDTAGAAWDNDEVSVSIPRGMTYRKVLESIFQPLGYEWDVTPTVATPGEWDLNIWNPDGRVTDVTSLDTPSLLVGQGTLHGYATKRVPRANIVTAEGQGGYSSRARNTASFPVIGRREGYTYDQSYVGALVEGWADTLLAKFLSEGLAPRFDIADQDTHPIPVVDYGLAYRLNCDLADGGGKFSRDIEAISWRDSDEGLTWTIHTGQAQFDQPLIGRGGGFVGLGNSGGGGGGLGLLGPTVEGTRWLLDKFLRQTPIPIATALAPATGGGELSVTVASSTAPDFERGKADLLCSGTGDANIIMQAAAMLGSVGGRIKLSSGRFFIDPGIINFDTDIFLEGTGLIGTTLDLQADGVCVELSGAADAQISNMGFTTAFAVTGAGSTAIWSNNNGETVLRDLWFFDFENAWLLEANQSRASGLRTQGTSVTYLVRSTALGGYRELTLSDCWTAAQIDLGNMVVVTIVGNLLGNITGTDCQGWVIAANSWIDTTMLDLGMDGSGGFAFPGCVVTGNSFAPDGLQFLVADSVEGLVISNNRSHGGGIELTACPAAKVIGNDILTQEVGIGLTGCDHATVADNTVAYGDGTANTFDLIQVTGSDRVLVTANMLRPNTAGVAARYGVNVVSGECNMVVGNDLGDPDDYGTDALSDTGSNTQLTWPNDPTYGDNFTDCGSGS